ncbi:glycoside hydrolase family 15 protein [Ktedonobacter racemifer]|uniref:Glycoside hydrolase 15-related protein n=1 Tax=Ktedonobacter racemifer DSM 44963 TaxID=485913 RepID=D6TE18_KTERA|nr:glycoside hydrolase family 15 protein [Ktedonobacter racemifer]EFH88391.1 glycoside hydrolase 15-related protein [Ktedonobacter racemifer DSM 44963]
MAKDHLQETCLTSKSYLPIEDYGMIGDLHTVALIGKNGSIDWCCLPRFDSPSVFGRLLDVNKGGFFRIAPPESITAGHRQLYWPETNILITRFLTNDGVGQITDFMPVYPAQRLGYQHQMIRMVKVVRGSLDFCMECRPAFNYAREAHELQLSESGALFQSSELALALDASVPLEADDYGGVHASFTLQEGESAYFSMECVTEGELVIHYYPQYYEDAFLKTRSYWQNWLSQCQYLGRWREVVRRSALVLKLLTYAPTGAIVAAPTTSLPETIGGARNWDYRFTWLRDAAFTLYSLLLLGFSQEAEAFMGWLNARCHEMEEDGGLQPIYGIDGSHDLSEHTLDHLEGYLGSSPVRIGNGAYNQKQLDIYGELMDAIYIYNRYEDISYDLWQNLRRLLGWLTLHWHEPDEGIWEVRGGPKPFVHSRLMSWVAFDRAIRLTRHRGWYAPLEEWLRTSGIIYEEIMRKGWSDKKGSFVQYYGSEAVDASALLISITKFLGATDPRMLSTVECIKRELSRDSLVYRYHPEQAADDGLRSQEGVFSPCSFWLAEALANAGQLEEARLILENVFTYANHLGLYAEEIGPTGEALGNYPQAFTHLSLITACHTVDQALNNPMMRYRSREFNLFSPGRI